METPSFTLPATVRKAIARSGQFTGFLWVRPLKTLKGVTAQITKEVRTVARVGLDHDNRKAVQEAREDGTLPAENQGLKWGKWLIFPFLITHTPKGQDEARLYLRLYPVAGRKPRVVYRINGQIARPEEVKPLCLASEFKEVNEEIGCMTIQVSHLRNVR